MIKKNILREVPWQKLLGNSIRKYRLKKNFTQSQAAEFYGCSLRWWQQLEMGRNLSVKTLLRIGKILLVKPWLLLRW